MPEKSVIAEKRAYNMTPEVKERIDQIRHGIVPEGYKKTKVGIVPVEWTEYAIADCLKRVERPVEVKSDEMYTQIGIRSHGKGLFYKEPVNGKALGNKSVFWIEPDCFVLNIVFAWEQAIGKTTQKEVGMIGSHRFPMYRPINERVDIDYLIFYLMTKRGKDILEAASPGGAGRNRTLGQDRFMNSKIVLPTLTEQKKIASILTMQDKIIELEQQKIEEIKKAKRFFLEKMFPKEGQPVPEIRFKGFTAPWEQRKLGELVNVCSGRDYKHLSDGDIPVYGTGGYMLSVNEALSYDKDAIGIGRKGTIDKPYILNAPFWTVDTLFYAIPRENVDLNFAFDVFQNIDWKKKDESTGVPSLSKIAINEIDILVPQYDEQQSLGQFFNRIDSLITLHQRELAEVEKYKKALMQLLLTGLVRVNA